MDHGRRAAILLGLFAMAAPCSLARAQEAPLRGSTGDPRQAYRPFVFSSDAVTLAPGRVALESGAGYNGVLQSGTLLVADARRFDTWLGANVGLTDRLDLAATALLSESPGRGVGFGEGRVELRARLLDFHRTFPVALLLGGGYQSDSRFESAFVGLVAAVLELGRFALTVNLRGIHFFQDGRDPLDIYVTAGASVRATEWLRVGAEYVGEELEESEEGEVHVDGGSRHYLGPSGAVYLARGRLRLNLTAGAVLASTGRGPMARGSIAWLF